MPIDIDHLRSWIGREEVAEDVITPVPVAALAATLDRDDPKPRRGDELPPLWHWLYFLPTMRQSELGPDGHSKRGGFLQSLVDLGHRLCGPNILIFGKTPTHRQDPRVVLTIMNGGI